MYQTVNSGKEKINKIDKISNEVYQKLISETDENYVMIKKIIVKTAELIIDSGKSRMNDLMICRAELEEKISENSASLDFIFSVIETEKKVKSNQVF